MINKFGIDKYNPYIVTFCVSIVLSYFGISTDKIINHDGIFFMDAAIIFINDGMEASFNTYDWPFYSWLIAIVHQVSWAPYIEQTAHFINTLFIAATCLLFIRIYSEITNGESSLWVAVILILTLVGINKYRADIMRDFAYWFFFLTGFLCLLRYYRRPDWQMAICWQILLGLAFLMRIEALAIIILGPWTIFLNQQTSIKQRIIQVSTLYWVYAVGLITIAVVYLTGASNFNIPLNRLLRILDFIDIGGLINSYDMAVNKLGEIYWYEGLNIEKYYGELATTYAFTLLAYVLLKIIICLSVPYFVVLCFGIFKKHLVLNQYNRIILYFVAFQFLFFTVYMIKGGTLSPRYTISLVFMLLLLLGQVLERLLPKITGSRYKKKILVMISAYLIITTVVSTISTQGDSNTHILQASYWVRENVAPSFPVYSNYYKALYYTGRGRSFQDSMTFKKLVKKIKNNIFGEDVYLIIRIKHEQGKAYTQKLDELIKAGRLDYLIEFANDDHDRSVIYKLRST